MQPSGLDNIVISFQHGFMQAFGPLMNAGMDLAYGLALVMIMISVLIMLLRGEALHKLLSNVLYTGVLIGLFFTSISLVGHWVPEFINGFITAGGQAGHLTGIDPNSIFSDGLYIAGTLIEAAWHLGLTHIPTLLFVLLVSFFIVILYALIATDLAVVLVKSYALVVIGPIVMALGPLELTRPTVANYVRSIIGIGINLLMLYIVIGVGVTISKGWVNLISQYAQTSEANILIVLSVAGGLVMFYLIVKNVPTFIAGLSGAEGFRNYGDAAVASALGASALAARALTSPASAARGAMSVAGHSANIANLGLTGGKLAGGAVAKGVSTAGSTGSLSQGAFSAALHVAQPAINRVVQGPK